MGAISIKKIAECAEVLSGFSMPGRVEHDPGGTHHVILARHLKDGRAYTYSRADEVKIVPERDAEHYLLRPGDVLFMSRGSRNTAVVMQSLPPRTIASLSFYVLRAKAAVEPAYLAWCLNQSPAQAAIAQIRTGAGTPLVPRKELGEIKIPLPPLAIQRKIAHLDALMSRERKLVGRLLEETERAHRLVGDRLTRSMLDNGRTKAARGGR